MWDSEWQAWFRMLTGDYNGNGIVDAADYTVWRDTLGDDRSPPTAMTPDSRQDRHRPITTSGKQLRQPFWLGAVRVPPCPSRRLCGCSSPES